MALFSANATRIYATGEVTVGFCPRRKEPIVTADRGFNLDVAHENGGSIVRSGPTTETFGKEFRQACGAHDSGAGASTAGVVA